MVGLCKDSARCWCPGVSLRGLGRNVGAYLPHFVDRGEVVLGLGVCGSRNHGASIYHC